MRRLLLFTLLTLLACERGQLRANNQVEQTSAQRGAARIVLSSQGLENLYTDALAGSALTVRADPASVLLNNAPDSLRLGPLEQPIQMTTLEATPTDGALAMDLRFDDLTLFVPMRWNQGAQTSICRWSVQFSQAALQTELVADTNNPGFVQTQAPPEVVLLDARVDPVGGCELPTTESDNASTQASQAELEAALVDYTRSALATSLIEVLRRAPGESIGVLSGGFELTHLSTFESRRGQLRVANLLSEDTPLTLTPRGLELTFDDSILAQPPARCAPPLALSALEEPRLGEVPDELLSQFRADVAFVLSRAVLRRTAEAMTLSGFLCRGLEGLGADLAREASIPTRDFNLADIGIGEDLLGERVYLSISPGSLPELRMLPETNAVQVRWRSLQLDAYVDVLGTPTRLLELVVDVGASMRPVAPEENVAGSLSARVETIAIEQASLTSEWLSAPVPEAQLALWARRTMLLAFGTSIELPLPLLPTTPLRVVGAQVREEDLVLLLRFSQGP